MNNLHTPPKFLQKPSPPYFFMVHLLHRLYGVDAPAQFIKPHNVDATKVFLNKSTRRQHHVTTFTLTRRLRHESFPTGENFRGVDVT